MKIAICISGHIRNMIVLPIIEKLESLGINYDIYISSWNTTGKWLEPTHLPYDEKIDKNQARLGIYEHDRSEIDTNLFTNIKNIYKYEVEDDTNLLDEIINLSLEYKDIIEPGHFDMDREEQRKYQIFSMFRKCQKSIELIDNPLEYDLILRTRFDSIYNLDRVIFNINKIINENLILIPSNFEFGGENAQGGARVCDSFALGTPKNMLLYSKTYDFLKNKSTIQLLKDKNIWFCPHSLLKQHLVMNNLNYFKDDLSYNIIRENNREITNFQSIWNKK